MGLLRKPFLLPLIVCHAELIGRRTLSDGANQWDRTQLDLARQSLSEYLKWVKAGVSLLNSFMQVYTYRNSLAIIRTQFSHPSTSDAKSTDFNVLLQNKHYIYKITVTCKYMRTQPDMPCYPASLPSFHPLSVILGTDDRTLPVAFKPTLKPQSQCYIYHTDAWWE